MTHRIAHDPDTDTFTILGQPKFHNITAKRLALRLQYLSGLGHTVVFNGHAFLAMSNLLKGAK